MVTLGCSEAEGVLLEEEAVVVVVVARGVLSAARSRGSTGVVGFCGGLVADGRSVAMATRAPPLFLRFNRSVEEDEEEVVAVEEAVMEVVLIVLVAVVAVVVAAAAVGGCVVMMGTFIAFKEEQWQLANRRAGGLSGCKWEMRECEKEMR